MSDIAIKVEKLKKQYRLGTIGGGTLTADLQSWWARKRGKEDPNTKIGTDQTQIGESFYALDDINFEIKKGEAVGIIGANGAGKSTLLKLLSRVTAPTEGRICINGRITSMLEVGTGFHPELTGRENIYMNGAILGMTKAEIDEKIEDIIEFSECRQFIDTPVKRYSSGMYVKLGFSVASHLDSEILIVDEILAVGDMKFQNKCLSKIRELVIGENKTTLYVSHNMNTIQKLCDRCIVLDHGKMIYDGGVDGGIKRYFNYRIENAALLDLRKAPRFALNTQNVRMLEFEFLNKTHAIFYMNETAKCRLRFQYEIVIPKLTMKFILRFVDSSIAGLYMMKSILHKSDNNIEEVCFDMNFSHLAPGTYEYRIVLFELLENGMESGHDTLQFCGELTVIQGADGLNNLNWVHNTYGHTYFGELERTN